MLTIIHDYDINTIKDGLKYLLKKASNSEQLRELAIQITYTEQDSIATIYDWVKNNMKYVPDPVLAGDEEAELFISPVRMIKDYHLGKPLAGDCDDMALLAVAFCRSIGIKSNVVILDTVGEGYDHAIARAYSEKLEKWVILDPSTSEIPLGWEEKYVSKVIV